MKAITTRRIQSQEASHESMEEAVNEQPVEKVSDKVEKTRTEKVSENDNATTVQSSTANESNFLWLGAKQAKAARSARSALRAGIDRSSKRQKASHSGSGVPLTQVVRLKYVKGFTQAVRTPCYPEDL